VNNPHEIKTVKCAHCGAVRQETNHWFVILVTKGRFRCAPLLVPLTIGGTGPRSKTGRTLRKAEEPVCGQQCAQKIFEKYLAQERLNRPRRSLERQPACGPVSHTAAL
jgi:hypothetical protein